MSIIGTIHEDVTSDVLGKIGPWQWLVTFVSTVLMLPAIFNQYEDMFLLHPSEVMCEPPKNYDVANASLCLITNKNNKTEINFCTKWNLKLMWFIWLTKTWLIFCDHNMKWLSTAIISRFGYVFGFIIIGLIADSFGRKTAIIINVCADFVLGLTLTFCDSEGWFRLLVFLKSLFGSGSLYIGLIIVNSIPANRNHHGTVHCTAQTISDANIHSFKIYLRYYMMIFLILLYIHLVCEIASNTWRSRLCVIVAAPRLITFMCMVPLANSMPNSETYSFISCLFCIVYIVSLRWCPESPQWLLYNRKIPVAEKLISNAAKINGIKLCNEFKIRPVNHRAYNCLDEPITCMGILTTHNIRILLLVSSVFWLTFHFLWSLLYARVYSAKLDVYFLLKLLSSFSVLGCLTALLSIKLSLKCLIFLHVLLTGTFATIAITTGKITSQCLISAMSLSSGVLVHGLILNVTPRFFAINIRALTFGFCHAAGQLGSIISYLLFLFHPMNNFTLLAIEITAIFILAGLCFMLPTIDGRELPDVMEDMDYFLELSKPLRWATQKTSSPSREEIEMRIYSFSSGGQAQVLLNSDDRIPPQPLGFVNIWRRFIRSIHRFQV